MAYGRQDVLVFKKRNKVISRYWKGSTIAFQLKDRLWQKGEITRIQNDSFFIRPMVVHYNVMGTDTLYFNISGFAVTDVWAMPNTGILIDFINGQFQISRSGGHVHFYWVKSGWIFRAGGAIYAGLNIANGLINNDLSISAYKTHFIGAAAAFLVGVVLHWHYKPYLQVGRKYHLKMLKLTG